MNDTLSDTTRAPLSIAVIGAGPVGLALALQAARSLPEARISVFDKRPPEHDVAADPRTLALSLGSVQEFERLGVWRAMEAAACAITTVHVSQQQPSMMRAGLAAALGAVTGLRADAEPELLITAIECGVEQLGAVASYGAIVAPLQVAWLAEVARDPQRLAARFGTEVSSLKSVAGGVEVDAGIAEVFDLAVVAEGGVFSARSHETPAPKERPIVRRDYGQTAWVGQVTFAAPPTALDAGTAYERFTPHGPAALLPLPAGPGPGRAALVWCVDSADDPVRDLDDAQRLAVLNSVFHRRVGRLGGITALKAFALGLQAERTLVARRDGSRVVRIGNAAQTLHPVAGQGLNLGLRDAHALVAALRRPGDVDSALRRVEWQRAPDRWTLIAATDFLARSFTWRLPGLASARGLGLSALQAAGPARRAVAQQMMFGMR